MTYRVDRPRPAPTEAGGAPAVAAAKGVGYRYALGARAVLLLSRQPYSARTLARALSVSATQARRICVALMDAGLISSRTVVNPSPPTIHYFRGEP